MPSLQGTPKIDKKNPIEKRWTEDMKGQFTEVMQVANKQKKSPPLVVTEKMQRKRLSKHQVLD